MCPTGGLASPQAMGRMVIRGAPGLASFGRSTLHAPGFVGDRPTFGLCLDSVRRRRLWRRGGPIDP